MVSKEEMNSIIILSYLTDEMKERLIPAMDQLNFQKDEVVFREGEPAERFFMLKRGKILLEKNLAQHVKVSFGSIKPGYSFGWSAILGDEAYSSYAVAVEGSEVFSVKTERLMGFLEADHHMGYILMQRFIRVIKSRLDHRTDQFLRSIKNHPDMQNLFQS